MDFNELQQILEMIREHHLTEFELEQEGFRVRIKKDGVWRAPGPVQDAPPPAAAPAPGAGPGAVVPAPAPAAVPAPPPAVPRPDADEVEFAIVKSPIVGTFYRAPEPNAPPFVKVGDVVRKGQVLCILEAMKLMNEIDSECDGEIVKIYVENAQPVQYGERMFAIKVRS